MNFLLATRQSGAVLAIAMALACTQATAQASGHDRASLERRVQSVGTLIESSSAARQIEASGIAGARERRDSARLIHREAARLVEAGDLALASELLTQAAREMIAGARMSKPEQIAQDKHKRDFEARLGSTRALLKAQQRITKEKGAGAEAQQATQSIEQQLAQAEELAGKEEFERARPLLERAYLMTRVSIESMRRGDTLVRSLNFGSKKEEYEYEIDRNDTHRMLVTVLLADRKEAGTLPATIPGLLEASADLRRQAEGKASAGDHEAGIKLLEGSTRELVRAIRAGGVYVPG